MKASAMTVTERHFPFWTTRFPALNGPHSPQFLWVETVAKGECQRSEPCIIGAAKTDGWFRVSVTPRTLTGLRRLDVVLK